MPVSIDAEGFAGEYVSREEARVSLAGQARFAGCVALAREPRDDVARVLPGELELAGAGASHPLVFVFGDLSDGATLFGGLTFPLGIGYREFALLVPFVRVRGDSRLCSFVPRMYSSYFPATWNGNAFYGLAKETAAMQWHGRDFAIRPRPGEPVFRGALRGEAPWADGRLEALAPLRAMLRMPVLGRRGVALVRSWFDWDFAGARSRATEATLQVGPGLAEGLRPGAYTAVDRSSFELAGVLWRLSFPGPVGRADPAPRAAPASRPTR